jgi:hypothetical protein
LVGALYGKRILENDTPATTNEFSVTEDAPTRFATKRRHGKEPWIEEHPRDKATSETSSDATPTETLNNGGADKPDEQKGNEEYSVLEQAFGNRWPGARDAPTTARAIVF